VTHRLPPPAACGAPEEVKPACRCLKGVHKRRLRPALSTLKPVAYVVDDGKGMVWTSGSIAGGKWNSSANASAPHPECFFVRSTTQAYQDRFIYKAAAWWSTMHLAWRMVSAWEGEQGRLFSRVVFSRPDIVYHEPMGPWCAYSDDVWYSGGFAAPDMFWVLPRRMAGAVLSSHQLFLSCAPGQACCGFHSEVSWWVLRFWVCMNGFRLSTALAGVATVLPSARRKCRLLIGGGEACGRSQSEGGAMVENCKRHHHPTATDRRISAKSNASQRTVLRRPVSVIRQKIAALRKQVMQLTNAVKQLDGMV